MKRAFLLLLLLIAGATQAQLIKTTLSLTVRDELGNTVEGAVVKLYENEADYTAEKNPSAEGATDKKGIVKFKDLKAIAYYIIARKGDKDNAGGAEKTEKLAEKKINKTTIVIQ